ncbi:flagellin [Bacillus cereus]|uniref:flagellin N-terminal helical domain-containing protein n=1 Tax=Bacillus cereus group TaxID=86661 RepID=UPI000BEB59B5|nr:MULTISPECIES: flagellin [Bacillus cereus group]WIK97476.1 flagellin [Bacillus bombysepticus]PEA95056.1 flagellin [Bacillus cereus]PED37682.1 flagellin [Bacillus cereus]PEF51578.1 flagellin [Bacillus thuringiensis]PEG04923.1 flagellin [Bacillus cereus]
MRINTNINSLRTQEYMRQNQSKMSNSMDRLSSGKRINNASDDAAGLAIATRMRARESGLNVAANNTQDGMSLIRTADSAMHSVSNILLRMRDIANQSANGTNTDSNKSALQKEFDELQKQITYIADNTQFNDKNLLKEDSEVKIQTLDSSSSEQQIGINLKAVTLEKLGIDKISIGVAGAAGGAAPAAKIEQKDIDAVNNGIAGLTKDSKDADVTAIKDAFAKIKGSMDPTEATAIDDALKAFKEGAATDDTVKDIKDALKGATLPKATDAAEKDNALEAVKAIDKALTTVADNRATLGATLNRLDFNVNNLKSQSSSMASAASQIEDADMAKEMSEMTKFKILNEAGISMLSQANQTPQMVSKLLQ